MANTLYPPYPINVNDASRESTFSRNYAEAEPAVVLASHHKIPGNSFCESRRVGQGNNVSDSQSNSKVNPGATRGITVGSAKDGSLRAFIPDPDLGQVDVNRISGASGITADDMGTIYAADVGTHNLRKYVRVK